MRPEGSHFTSTSALLMACSNTHRLLAPWNSRRAIGGRPRSSSVLTGQVFLNQPATLHGVVSG